MEMMGPSFQMRRPSGKTKPANRVPGRKLGFSEFVHAAAWHPTLMLDHASCRLAKAKRERLRQAHLAPDYVPLGGTAKLLARAGAGAAGRGGPEQEVGGWVLGLTACMRHTSWDVGRGAEVMLRLQIAVAACAFAA